MIHWNQKFLVTSQDLLSLIYWVFWSAFPIWLQRIYQKLPVTRSGVLDAYFWCILLRDDWSCVLRFFFRADWWCLCRGYYRHISGYRQFAWSKGVESYKGTDSAGVASRLSNTSLYASGGRSHLSLSTSIPSLYTSTVGSDLIPCVPLRYFCSSVFTFATIACHSYFLDRWGMSLPSIWQGPHQSAKKSTITTQLAMVVSKSSCVRWIMMCEY